MAAADTPPERQHPLPLYRVIYERLIVDAGPERHKLWVRAQSSEHAAWKTALLVHPHGWELVEVIRIK